MTGASRPDSDRPAVGGATSAETDAADLVAQIRQLAGHDPAGVQQVVAEVLAALDRASGGRLRDQLPPGTPFGADFAQTTPRRGDIEPTATGQRPADGYAAERWPADPA